jgi:hypothetical protein
MGCYAGLRLSAHNAAGWAVRLLPRHGAGLPDTWNGHGCFVLSVPWEERRSHPGFSVFVPACAEAGLYAASSRPGSILCSRRRLAQCSGSAAAQVLARQRLHTPNLKLLPSQAEPVPSCVFARLCALRLRVRAVRCISVGGRNEIFCCGTLCSRGHCFRQCFSRANPCRER